MYEVAPFPRNISETDLEMLSYGVILPERPTVQRLAEPVLGWAKRLTL